MRDKKTVYEMGVFVCEVREIVCGMGLLPSRAKLRLDFSAFLSIAILQAERLIERRI
jgi:hypothetical protein